MAHSRKWRYIQAIGTSVAFGGFLALPTQASPWEEPARRGGATSQKTVILHANGGDSKEDEDVTQAQASQPSQPAQPAQPAEPAGAGGGTGAEGLLGPLPSADVSSLVGQKDPARVSTAEQPSADVISGRESAARSTTDLGSLISKSDSALGTEVQKRAPLANEPRIRGYHLGQIQTAVDGSWWYPARADLDTMLSKIDSGIIRDTIILKGPYSAQYGPGFSFIDVETSSVLPSVTQQGQNGFWASGRLNLNYQTQGQQFYGRQTVWGGSSDWGFRMSYGHRTGNDYDDGDGDSIPSSYNARDVDTAFGYELSQDSHIEFGFRRLDQTNTEYPGEVFDIDFLVTDGYNLRYTMENQCYYDRLVVESWYNRTRFEGNAQNSGKRKQIPELNPPNPNTAGVPGGGVLGFTGFTDVDEMSTGFRIAMSWGEAGCANFTLGVDLRYQKQELNEFDAFDPPGPDPAVDSNFPIPRSHESNPGLFAEYMLPLKCDRLKVKVGARLDTASADLEGSTVDRTRSELKDILNTSNFDKDYLLWAAYMTVDYDITSHWSIAGGFGHAERPPTLTELYAVDPFLAILQQGFTQVRGNPNLDLERLWQVDLGVKADYGRWRGGLSGFYAWIDDYVTYQAFNVIAGVDNGLQVKYVNTDLATLSGFEGYSEFDCNGWMTPFARVSYVEGRDHSRGSGFVDVDGDGFVSDDVVTTGSDEEPLPSISPFETRVGIRFHQPCPKPRWGIEIAARIVEDQDRVATSLLEQRTGGFTTYDLRGYWQAADHLLLVSGIENFTDKNYREHLDLRTGHGVFQPGINFYFGLELTF
jgi:iron complex outermembrane receptor protein